ncbi:MAG: hypothetical protein HOV80_17080 [Polyangiaceae bacterium]|nr:hypothetical protein [Polyangiaceae bacterium]
MPLLLALACSSAPPPQTAAPIHKATEARTVRYCEDVEWLVHDVACLGHIPEAFVPHREFVYKATIEHGKTVMVEEISSDDTGEKIRKWTLTYEEGEMREERSFNGSGVLAMVRRYDPGGRRERAFDDKGRPFVARRSRNNFANYNRIDVERDARGFYLSRRFMTPSGAPATSDLGVHQVRHVRDDQGFDVEVRAFDIDGQPTGLGDGAHRHVKKRDGAGRLVRLERYDTKGRPFAGLWHGAVQELTYDEWGNRILERQRDATGRVLRDTQLERDDSGAVTRIRFFDGDGTPLENSSGIAEMKFVYDDRGLTSQLTQFDGTGKVKGKSVIVHDDRRRFTSVRWFDAEGKPKGGLDSEYDDSDRLTRKIRFKGPGEIGETYAIRFDDRGRPTERRYLDPKGGVDDKRWCPIVSYLYDDEADDAATPSIFCLDRDGTRLSVILYRMFTTKSKERAEEALARINDGERFRDVEAAFGSDVPFEETPLEERIMRANVLEGKPFWGELTASKAGAVVGPVEVNGEFFIGVREQ